MKAGDAVNLVNRLRLDIVDLQARYDFLAESLARHVGAIMGRHSGVIALGSMALDGTTVTIPEAILYGVNDENALRSGAMSDLAEQLLITGMVVHHVPSSTLQSTNGPAVLDLAAAESQGYPVSIFWRRKTADTDLDTRKRWDGVGAEETFTMLTRNREYVEWGFSTITNWADPPDSDGGWQRFMLIETWVSGAPGSILLASPFDGTLPLSSTSLFGRWRFTALNSSIGSRPGGTKGSFTAASAIHALWVEMCRAADSDRRIIHNLLDGSQAVSEATRPSPSGSSGVEGYEQSGLDGGFVGLPGRKQLAETVEEVAVPVEAAASPVGAGALWSANIAADGAITTSFGLSGVTVARENEGGLTQYVYTLTIPGVTLLTGFHAQALNGVWAANLNVIVARLQTVTVVGSDLVIKYSLHKSTTDSQGQALVHYVTVNGGTA